jgi:hypothetical protein
MGKISKASALLLTLIIAISCLALLTPKPADAQTIPKPSVPESVEEPKITIVSPTGKQVERNTTVELEISVLFMMSDSVRAAPKGVQISYKLDNNSITPLDGSEMAQWSNGWWSVWVKTSLVDLAEGSHKVTAYTTDGAGLHINTTTAFTVDTSYEYPKMSVLSPQNKTYTTADIPVVVFVNGNISEGFVYLDAYPYPNRNFPIDNMTLSELKDGDYQLYFSATTERGETTETIAFSVNTDFFYSNQPIIITISSIAILLSVIALIGYKRVKVKKRETLLTRRFSLVKKV